MSERLFDSQFEQAPEQEAQEDNTEIVETSLDGLPELSELKEFQAKYLDKSIERNQIDMDDFDHVYDSTELARDKQKVAERKSAFAAAKAVETDQAKLEVKEKLAIIAKMFEVICADHSILSRAFNLPKGEVVAQMASDFDDILRKSDLFIEFPNKKFEGAEPKDYALGVDVTISKSRFGDKMRDQKRFFDDNEVIPEVKYFQESAYKQKGDLYEGQAALPKFIINVSPAELLKLKDAWELWSDNKNKLGGEREKQAYLSKLGIIDNPIWLRLVHQMVRQARDLEEYFSRNRDTKNAEMYGRARATLLEAESTILSRFVNKDRNLDNKINEIRHDRDPKSQQVRLSRIYNNKLQDLLDDNTKAVTSWFTKEFRKN